MNKINNTLGSKIKYYRKKKGINQKELADAVGIRHATTISKFENDKFYPKYKTLFMIAEYLGVSLDDLAIDYIKKTNHGYNDLSDPYYELFDMIDVSDHEILKLLKSSMESYKNLRDINKR